MAVQFVNRRAISEIHYRTVGRLRRTSARTHDLEVSCDFVCLLGFGGSGAIVGAPHIKGQWLVFGVDHDSSPSIGQARLVSCRTG